MYRRSHDVNIHSIQCLCVFMSACMDVWSRFASISDSFEMTEKAENLWIIVTSLRNSNDLHTFFFFFWIKLNVHQVNLWGGGGLYNTANKKKCTFKRYISLCMSFSTQAHCCLNNFANFNEFAPSDITVQRKSWTRMRRQTRRCRHQRSRRWSHGPSWTVVISPLLWLETALKHSECRCIYAQI